jgi:hypothetical protein
MVILAQIKLSCQRIGPQLNLQLIITKAALTHENLKIVEGGTYLFLP